MPESQRPRQNGVLHRERRSGMEFKSFVVSTRIFVGRGIKSFVPPLGGKFLAGFSVSMNARKAGKPESVFLPVFQKKDKKKTNFAHFFAFFASFSTIFFPLKISHLCLNMGHGLCSI